MGRLPGDVSFVDRLVLPEDRYPLMHGGFSNSLVPCPWGTVPHASPGTRCGILRWENFLKLNLREHSKELLTRPLAALAQHRHLRAPGPVRRLSRGSIPRGPCRSLRPPKPPGKKK